MSGQNKSIEEKMNELTEMVSWFDSDKFTIEKALDKFKEAEKLADEIEHSLLALKNEIHIVKQKFDGEQ